jgi:hypothetical protein
MMGAARKYPDELRDRAIRLVLDVVKDLDASVTAACRKVAPSWGSTRTRCAAGPSRRRSRRCCPATRTRA